MEADERDGEREKGGRGRWYTDDIDVRRFRRWYAGEVDEVDPSV